MSAAQPYILYTRPNCHLCELAAELLMEANLLPQVNLADIEADLQLIEKYGDRVPVFAVRQSGVELGWPFTREQLQLLLQTE